MGLSHLVDDARLSTRQVELLESWLPGAVVEADHTWEIAHRAVLEVRHGTERFIVKAGRPDDHHMDREVTAHRQWLAPLTRRGRAPQAVHLDQEARLLVSTYLPGRLVLDTPAADDSDTFEQAGQLLADPADGAGPNAR